MPTSLTLEFSGGSEFLVGNQKEHKVSLPIDQPTVSQLIQWIKKEILTDHNRDDLFVMDDSVRPGVLVLVNECDWELLERNETILKDGDVVTFISTLHGG
ncbi:unnamed protein product, partial [Mesorhabditis belari]|uniref:Ubiquitin-related modifier 1 homolog n=1 Tax=Mesorhabditis belari TaxID=2138241 RepID=A0AAF3EWX5_9BILA